MSEVRFKTADCRGQKEGIKGAEGGMQITKGGWLDGRVHCAKVRLCDIRMVVGQVVGWLQIAEKEKRPRGMRGRSLFVDAFHAKDRA